MIHYLNEMWEKVYNTKCEINDNNLKGVGGAMCI